MGPQEQLEAFELSVAKLQEETGVELDENTYQLAKLFWINSATATMKFLMKGLQDESNKRDSEIPNG